MSDILPMLLLAAGLLCSAAAQCQTFANASPVSIPDGAGSLGASTITVSGVSGNLLSLTVTLTGVTAPVSGDLDFLLVGPAGQRFMLMSDAGSTFAIDNATLLLSDAASVALPRTTQVSTGMYRPTDFDTGTDSFVPPAPAAPYLSPAPVGSATFASTFLGANPNGTWTLYATDDTPGGGADVLSGGWSLDVTAAVPVATTLTLTQNVDPSYTTAPNNYVTFLATVLAGPNPAPGTVTFTSGATTLAANVPLNTFGQCTALAWFTIEGARTVTATYNAAPGYLTSSSNVTHHVEVHPVVDTIRTDTTIVNTQVHGFAYTNPSSITIPGTSAGVIESHMIVADAIVGITGLRLRLNGLSSVSPADLDFLLVSPAGKKFVFMSDAGGNNPAYGLNLTFADDADSLLPINTVISSASFRPTDAGTGADVFGAPAPAGPYPSGAPNGTATLASFLPVSSQGTWKLFIMDDTPDANASTLARGWTIEFIAPVSTATTVTASVPNSFTTAPGQSVTFTATILDALNQPVTAGSVDFYDGATLAASSVPVSAAGTATLTTTTLTEGDHTISANYSGASGVIASSGSRSFTVYQHTVITVKLYCDPGPVTLRDGTTASAYPARLFVHYVSEPLTAFTVRLNGLTHASPADLDILLVDPIGTRYQIMAGAGGTSPVNAATVTLDGAAASALPSGAGLATGRYRPAAYVSGTFPAPAPAGPYPTAAPIGTATLASAFGPVADGNWDLYVIDRTGGNGGGTLADGWCMEFSGGQVGVPGAPSALPTKLLAPRPTPMLTGATIAYTLAEAGAVRVDVIDTAGRLVRILREAHDALGSHQLHWDGRDTGGRDVPGGVYFVRLRAGSTLSVQRLVRVR